MVLVPKILYSANKQKLAVGDMLRVRDAISSERNANGQTQVAIFATSVFSYALQYHIFPHLHAGQVRDDYKLDGLYILTRRPNTEQYDRTFIAYSMNPVSYVYQVCPTNFEQRRLHEYDAGVRDEYVNFDDVRILARIDITPDIIKADGVDVYIPKNVFARKLIQSVFGRRLMITDKSIQSIQSLLKLTRQY